MPLVMGHSKRYFSPQSFINCAFYSAIACLYPFLNSQLSELGLSWTQCAWINSVSALVSMAGPLCLGPLAHKLSGYKQGLVASLLLAFISCTALLFVPSVISSEHTPKMYFDCSEGVFRVEQCPNWNGQCHIYPKRPATNFSSFELVTCSYVCPDDKTPVNSSWYPINVCFHNTNEHISNLCLDVPRERIISVDASSSPEASIQFDSRFDRWPVIDSTENGNIVDRMFDGLRTCTFKPAPPLIISAKLFGSIQCRPFVPNCNIYCSVNLRHRTNGPSGSGQTRVRPPTPCHLEQGNRQQTLHLYLLFRSLVDLSLLTGHTLIEAIRIAGTNDYDAFYGGIERFWTMALPFIVWPPFCGLLSDYFVQVNAPTFAPSVVIFDGFIAITIFLVIMLPLKSTQAKETSSSTLSLSGQKVVLQPTKFRYPRTHTNQYLFYRLALVMPLVLILGTLWGLTESLTRPFYRRALQSSNFQLGMGTCFTFLVTGPFALMAKSLITGIGRMHLILLAFVFYSLRSAGTSFLIGSGNVRRWLMLPFEMMGAFTLPLAWVGITSYGQHLIKRSPNGLSYASGTTIFQTYSPHVIMQYTLNLMHFGGGRALGAAFSNIWLTMWPDVYSHWLWLTNLNQTAIDNYALESITDEESAVRVLLRLVSLISLMFGTVFFVLYHSCCFNCFIPRHEKYQSPSNQDKATKKKKFMVDKNGQTYLKLKAKSENEVYPLKSKPDKNHGKTMPPIGETTRSMVTLRDATNNGRELETSVDDYDDEFDHKI